jgi:hypothetical protein
MLGINGGYPPRLEKLEYLAEAIFMEESFRRRTLGGFMFSVHRNDREIRITKESKIVKNT